MQNAAALVVFIDVRNKHDCYIKSDYVRICLTPEKYWHEIRDELVPIEELVPIFLRCETYEV